MARHQHPPRFLAATLLLAGAASAQPALVPYQLTLPAGWSRTDRGGGAILAPPGEPAGTAFVAVLGPDARQPDLDAQLGAMLRAIEAGSQLREPRGVTQQRLGDATSPRRIHVATYSSPQGERHLGLLLRADGQQVGAVLLLTTTGGAFERLRAATSEVFNGMRLGGAPVAAAGTAAAPGPARAGGFRGKGIVGVWAGLREMRRFDRVLGGHLITVQAWYVFFDDGELLVTFPDEGLAGFDREAFRARYPSEWGRYAFDGVAGEVQRQQGMVGWKLLTQGPNHLQIVDQVFHRCPDPEGMRLDGTWFQRSSADADDPDLTRRPPGARPLIRFTRAGRFEDEGLFRVAIPSNSGGDDRAGSGTYQIHDYSLVLRYDDGRVRQEAFPGCGPEQLGAGKDAIFIRNAGLHRR